MSDFFTACPINNLHIRPASPADAGEIMDIYRYYVNETTVSFELTEPTVDEFAQRIGQISQNYPYLVAEQQTDDGRKILGYAYAGAYKNRAAYDWAVEVTVYLADDAMGQGLGRLLYQKLEGLLAAQGIRSLNACISGENEESLAFHRALGYVDVGHNHRCGYKLGRWLDVFWLEKLLDTADTPPAAFIPFAVLDKQVLAKILA